MIVESPAAPAIRLRDGQGAQGVCIGRPYIWGLGAFGQAGVERTL
jgi:isopentenyl diphosphate isomerase/L-lactate dehydrogenase-like FMN-dependent dehydrogenase